MQPLFNGNCHLYVHTDDARAILEAIQLARDYQVKLVIVGGADSWMVADQLSEAKVGVILGATHSLPQRDDDDIDQPFKTPRQLFEKGVVFALSMDGSWQQRNLMFQAGQAVGFGLPAEAALRSITLDAARLLGIGDRTGSLEVGKDATLILTVGDALDVRSSIVTHAWFNGNALDLDDKQKALYRQYARKYGLDVR
jgi:imidazolonepropionase-like amidohydrolase